MIETKKPRKRRITKEAIPKAGEIKVSTFTVAALFSKMAVTGPRIVMVDMVFLVLQHFHIYRRGGWSQSLPLKIFYSCSLGGGGGRYLSVPRKDPAVLKRLRRSRFTLHRIYYRIVIYYLGAPCADTISWELPTFFLSF